MRLPPLIIGWLRFTRSMTFHRSTQHVRINIFDVQNITNLYARLCRIQLGLFLCSYYRSLTRFHAPERRHAA